MGIENEELEGLSEEERAALADDDDDDSEILSKIAGDDGSDDDEGGDDNESGDGVDDEAGDAAAKDDAGSDAAGDAGKDDATGDKAGTDAAAPVVADEFQPELKAAAPEGLTEKIAEIDAKIKALRDQRREGTIELDAYDDQKDALDAQKLELKIAEDRAKWAQSQNEDARDQRWKWEQDRFFTDEKKETYKDDLLFAALNTAVLNLRKDPSNDKRLGWVLEEADRQVRSRFNMGEPAVKEVKQLNRQPDLKNVPKTLAQLPAAEMAETGDVEFAYLDKLSGIALEQALRKMTPEQEARYLGAA